MTTFLISINEYQRKLISQCLTIAIEHEGGKLSKQEGDADYNALLEAESLTRMLDTIVIAEKSNPGVIHGLCL